MKKETGGMGVDGSCLQVTVKWAYCMVLKAENFFFMFPRVHLLLCGSWCPVMLVTRATGGQGWELEQGQALGIHGE